MEEINKKNKKKRKNLKIRKNKQIKIEILRNLKISTA